MTEKRKTNDIQDATISIAEPRICFPAKLIISAGATNYLQIVEAQGFAPL